MNAGEDKESGKLANACKVNRSVAPNKVQAGYKAMQNHCSPHSWSH